MNKAAFEAGTKFEDNTYYEFNQKAKDIYKEKTTVVSDKKYLTIGGGEGKQKKLDTVFYLKGLKNVTLDFGGAVITIHGKMQPFIIDECSNITVKNVTVEYERSLFTELDIISRNGNELRARPRPKFPCRVENGNFIPYAKEWENTSIHSEGCIFIQAYDKKTRKGDGLAVIYLGENIVEQKSPPCDNIAHIRVKSDGEDIIFIGDLPGHWNEKDSIVLEHERRTVSSAAMYHSSDVTFENYRILNGGGMGFLAIRTNNITVDSARLEHDELSHGTVSNSADGIHFVACGGKIEIRDSIFEGMIDDALNIHSNFYQAEGTQNNKIFAFRSSASHNLNAHTNVFAPGDEIAVYKGSTMEEKQRFTVKNVQITGDWTIELTVDKSADGIIKNDLIENLTTNAQIHISNTRFAKANSHLRFQSRKKVVVENCEFELPILLTGDTNYWFESDPVTDITIKDCSFFGERACIRIIPIFEATEKESFYHSGIKVQNCSFESKIPLEAHYAKDILFEGNKFSDGTLFALEGCSNFSVK